ncbi:nuclear transport factor 2 family protein [Bradyrhizobium canariense]|uniref:SnoaL-like domain-containing protein n=1 Tax=Bradyrhizobium canariense TaxID=255045 RepID=A0A1H1NEV7_9BRAD|nr:nuclear transport factor 2 family protein [Bradyrhizobium canariense]SDR97432.1 SnoaL-like domain-containing protein [Bradyrhizobium canariense]
MRNVSADALPQVILDHVAAYRRHDAEAFMATLAPDALINDIQREFLGHPAIRAWADKEIFGPKVTLETEAAFEHFGNTIVRFRVDGDFDKSNLPDPLILTYYFAVQDDRITQLIILHNKAVAI